MYAGAAPGTHIKYLAELFPTYRFFCVDPADFKLEPTDRIEVRQEFFTEETVAELHRRPEPKLFVSDIRTGDPKVQNNKEVEEAVKFDQELQKNWVLQLKPKASMLKFRLPWEAGTTTYLKGDIFLPIWGRETTTETRLISRGPEFPLVDYDNRKYEEQCFHFNRVTRVQWYEHDSLAKGMDHCYDCAAEDLVLTRYLTLHLRRDPTTEEVVQMSLDINYQCSPHSKRTMETQETFKNRQQWFTPRKYDYDNKTITQVERRNNPTPQLSRRKRDYEDDDRARNNRSKKWGKRK